MPDEEETRRRTRPFGGSITTWPGQVLLIVIVASALGLIVYFATHTYRDSHDFSDAQQGFIAAQRRIQDTTESERAELVSRGILEDVPEHVSEDGQVGNPEQYPDMGCAQPNYVSRNGKILTENADGTETLMSLKGINWFGLETSKAVPFGLWDNDQNGTTAYEIAAFLARNKFNSVRLPVAIANVLDNVTPERSLINSRTNRAISVLNFETTLSGITQALGYRHIGVMISLHTLMPGVNGGLWYNDDISEARVLESITMLASQLCNDKHWNVMGLDLMNEPHLANWGSGDAADWRVGAKTLGDHMLKVCPKWIAFVEGVNEFHELEVGGDELTYFDWWGGGLQNVAAFPLEFSQAQDKIIWTPHYYTPSIYPQNYMFSGGEYTADGALVGATELSDAQLKRNVDATMEDMFGYLRAQEQGAIVLGEFGGIYSTDKNPERTNQRVTKICLDMMKQPGYAGGFMWSLNPESEYGYNPVEQFGVHNEGLLTDSWREVRKDYVEALRALDDMEHLQKLTCTPVER